jgi:hypothetical protein
MNVQDETSLQEQIDSMSKALTTNATFIKEFILAEKAAADDGERRIHEQARIAADQEKQNCDKELAASKKKIQKEVER